MARDAQVVCYVDTSALLKRYLRETGSDAFETFCELPHLDRVIGPLQMVEFASALQRRIRLGALDSRQAGAARQNLIGDIAAGGWRIIDFESDVFAKANQLLAGLGTPLSALDALHLASAIQVAASAFATADRQLATAARKSKLAVHTF